MPTPPPVPRALPTDNRVLEPIDCFRFCEKLTFPLNFFVKVLCGNPAEKVLSVCEKVSSFPRIYLFPLITLLRRALPSLLQLFSHSIHMPRVLRVSRPRVRLVALAIYLSRNEDDYSPVEEDDLLLRRLLSYCLVEKAIRVSLRQPIEARRLGSLEDYEARFMPCEAAFRFTANEIRDLIMALRFPAVLRTSHGDRFEDWEALAILLRKLANPVRLPSRLPFLYLPSIDFSSSDGQILFMNLVEVLERLALVPARWCTGCSTITRIVCCKSSIPASFSNESKSTFVQFRVNVVVSCNISLASLMGHCALLPGNYSDLNCRLRLT